MAARTPELDLRDNPFKNYIINSNFDFWQRAANGLGSGSGFRFAADRWACNSTGSTYVPTRQSFTLGQTDVPNEPENYHRMVVTSVAGASNFCLLGHPLEGVGTLAGKKAVLSFWAKADSAKPIAIELTKAYGTGGSPSAAETGVFINKITLSTTWTRYSMVITLPSIAGKTLGTTRNDKIDILFWMDAGSTFNARTNTLGQQSGTFDIAQVMLNEGIEAADWQLASGGIRNLGAELALCQRFYEKSYNIDINPGTVTSTGWQSYISAGNSFVRIPVDYRVRKRGTPTINVWAADGTAGVSKRDNDTGPVTLTGSFVVGTKGFTAQSASHATNVEYNFHWDADAEL